MEPPKRNQDRRKLNSNLSPGPKPCSAGEQDGIPFPARPVQSSTTDHAFDMSLPAEVPRLPKLPFILIDVTLLGAAAYIALTSPAPLSGAALISVVILVALGAVALAVPFIADYGRKTDAILAERQDQIAALARSTATSAEQISIAVASLHGIGENAARSAKAIEGLPQKLQEKIAEFSVRLNEISAAGNEELEQEVQSLRSAESDRLVNAVDQLSATARELSRVETQTQVHAARVAEAVEALPRLAEQAAAKSVEGIVQSSITARKEIEALFVQQRALLATEARTTQGQHATMLDAAAARATVEFETTCSKLLGRITAQIDSHQRALNERLAQLSRPTPADISRTSDNSHPVSETVAAPASPSVDAITFTDQVTDEARVSADDDSAGPSGVAAGLEEEYPQTVRGSDHLDDNQDETALLSGSAASVQNESGNYARPVPLRAAVPRDGVSFDHFDEDPSDDNVPMALTENGSTRLLVTAYIGIGNRLFIRGNGAGLSWEKGVPLQFVSIGKWRWETLETQLPLSARLYKNDQIECASIGAFTLEPGKQRELTVTF